MFVGAYACHFLCECYSKHMLALAELSECLSIIIGQIVTPAVYDVVYQLPHVLTVSIGYILYLGFGGSIIAEHLLQDIAHFGIQWGLLRPRG